MAKANILVVDDEANILDSLRGILTDEGYDVCTAEDGDAALKVLQEQKCDLVLLDIWLPGRRDGLQTLREIRRRNIGAEVLMISGHGSIDTAVRATKLGAYDFIEKPLSLSALLEKVEDALRHARARAAEDPGAADTFEYIAGCPAMLEVREQTAAAAQSAAPALIVGEMGSGKEYTARFIHAQSARRGEPFVKVSCRLLTPASFDRLFGMADENPADPASHFAGIRGTVFLENPNLLDAALQARLAGLVAAGTGRGTGFIAAVTRRPDGGAPAVAGAPRSLFAGTVISLPPLRQRGEDIAAFIAHFMHGASEDFGKAGIRLSKSGLARMLAYPWPGNVKELRTVVENMVMAAAGDLLEPKDIPFPSAAPAPAAVTGGKRHPTQKTLGKSVALCGMGLHSGIKTGVIVSPLPPGSGIIFGDISTGRQVRADVDFVESTEYATTLKTGNMAVRTIEHLLATLHIYGITNALLKVGDEVPIMDGSAAEFCDLIEGAGIVDQKEPVEPLMVRETILLGERDPDKKFILVEPADRLTVEYRFNYPLPIGNQTARYDGGGIVAFKTEIAPARTFGFVDVMKKLSGKKGFAEGGRFNNFILLDREKVINTTLRFENEFSRHKVLDLLGDIYLAGRPVVAKITANMTGHTDNITLVRKLRAAAEEA